ncbi:hypothetical protein AURDEDRAFT_111888 [Auricularia subglabra TFB-10046 SS5]|nr:hypothetical protein AURDEDRAFT_111888 [Auricularia subglabra TFB-10046 SS5]
MASALPTPPDEQQPVVTTIVTIRDCNYGKPPGRPMAPCPPFRYTETVTIYPGTTVTGGDAEPTAPETEPGADPTASETLTDPIPTETTTSVEQPIVTTIWEQRDCNYGKPPGAPMAPCPPYEWSTVVTLTPTQTVIEDRTTVAPTPTPDPGFPDPETGDDLCPPLPGWDSGKTYSAGAHVFFHNLHYEAQWETIGELPDNNQSGVWVVYEPCSLPSATTTPGESTITSATDAPVTTTTTVQPIVTTIYEQRDCNYDNPPGAPMAPCPPYEWSTVVTITPTQTVTEGTPATTATPDPNFPDPETEDELCPPPPAWDSTQEYSAGAHVSFEDKRYEAQWGTRGTQPGLGESGVWVENEPCSIYKA